MKITPFNNATGSHRTGSLYDINAETISKILGFEPNIKDDEDKVVNSWCFKVNGKKCGVWDYKGSHLFGQYSTFGPAKVFEKLFPAHYV